jgi:hypothetical protein
MDNQVKMADQAPQDHQGKMDNQVKMDDQAPQDKEEIKDYKDSGDFKDSPDNQDPQDLKDSQDNQGDRLRHNLRNLREDPILSVVHKFFLLDHPSHRLHWLMQINNMDFCNLTSDHQPKAIY